MNYAGLSTEKRNPRSKHIDKMPTLDLLSLMNDEDRRVPEAIAGVLPAITAAVDAISQRMADGGRLIYAGAGTSGRLGVLDASECPPTFGVGEGVVIGLIAGGLSACYSAAEGAEDDGDAAVRDLDGLKLTPLDSVIGISAAGGAEYAVAAVAHARAAGCFTAAITSNPTSRLAAAAEVAVTPETGPEVLTGSTRLKAGTAQKLILNMISTAVMVKTGKVYENMMVNVRPTNKKLRDRAVRIISEITGAAPDAAEAALDLSGGSVREAIEYVKGS